MLAGIAQMQAPAEAHHWWTRSLNLKLAFMRAGVGRGGAPDRWRCGKVSVTALTWEFPNLESQCRHIVPHVLYSPLARTLCILLCKQPRKPSICTLALAPCALKPMLCK